MQEWEYKIVGLGLRMGGGMEKLLNEHGKQGWELVFVLHNGAFVFKRPVK